MLNTTSFLATLLIAGSTLAQTPAAPASTASGAPVTAQSSSPASAKPAAKPSAMPAIAAAGGGPGKVWVNRSSKVYHCENDKYYGKTRHGEYLLEADAKAKGFHGVGGKACGT